MKYFIIRTLMVGLPKESLPSEAIMVTLPSNATPIGIEVRPASFPEGLFIHHLIPCDENGNITEEVVATGIYETAWDELYKCFGERMEQENLDLMDAVLKAIIAEKEEEEKRKEGLM